MSEKVKETQDTISDYRKAEKDETEKTQDKESEKEDETNTNTTEQESSIDATSVIAESQLVVHDDSVDIRL